MVTNAQALCKNLKDLGYKIVTDGTDNHIVLVDLRNIKLFHFLMGTIIFFNKKHNVVAQKLHIRQGKTKENFYILVEIS